jgi:hypothetical protein
MTVESGPTTAELQARIKELLEQIRQLKTELDANTTLSEGIGWDAGIQAGIEALTALPKKGSIGGGG